MKVGNYEFKGVKTPIIKSNEIQNNDLSHRKTCFHEEGWTWVCFKIRKCFFIKLLELMSCMKISKFNTITDYDDSSVKRWDIALCINNCGTEFQI